MNPAEILAIGNQALARARAEHGDGFSLLQQLGDVAQASLAAHRSALDPLAVIAANHAEAQLRLQADRGGQDVHARIRQAAGEAMSKALVVDKAPIGIPAAGLEALEDLLQDMRKADAAQTLDQLFAKVRMSTVQHKPRPELSRGDNVDSVDRVGLKAGVGGDVSTESTVSRPKLTALEDPILAYDADLGGNAMSMAAREFLRRMERDLRAGRAPKDRRRLCDHAVAHWGVTPRQAAELLEHTILVHGNGLDQQQRSAP